MAANDLCAAIEIGQTSTKMVVGHFFNYQLNVVGRFQTPTKGFSNNRIQDRSQLVDTLKSLLLTVSQEKLTLSEVVLVVPPIDLVVLRRRANYMIPSVDRIITSNDIDVVLKTVGKSEIPVGMIPVEVAPIEYVIDGNRRTRDNPVGVYASTIQVDAVVSVIPKEFAFSIRSVMEEIGLPLSLITLSPYASFYSTCTTRELEEGIILVDIGGQTTTFTAIKDMQIIAHQTNKIGGHHLTMDLSELFKIDYSTAELLKLYAGNALATMASDIPIVHSSIPLSSPIKEIDIANVMEARLEDIIDELSGFIKTLSLREIIPVVLTGGSADIPNIAEKFSQMLKRNCRSAAPEHIGVQKGMFSSVVGSLIYYMQSTSKSDESNYSTNR